LTRTFSGEIAKIRAFAGEEKLKTAAIHYSAIYHGAGPGKSALCLHCLYLSPWHIPPLKRKVGPSQN
jgi:hypothetical protein